MRSVFIETQGCKLNQADSQALAKKFKRAGFTLTNNSIAADVYVLNSCTVTGMADRKARQTLRSLRRLNSNSFVVATGCYAERRPEELTSIEGVDLVIGNKGKNDLVKDVILSMATDQSKALKQKGKKDTQISRLRTRAMVKIQEGCDQVCSYCIVPKVRGRERSVGVKNILNKISSLERDGVKEVVLTGTQLISYGFDIPNENLNKLLQSILSNSSIPRIRISSLQPQIIDEELINLWENPRLCPHLHIPLQSGSDKLLERMKRRYDTSMFKEKINLIRDLIPKVSITTDVIVGFPGESDSDFQNTYDLCQEIGFAHTHTFPYSNRPGTSAAHFDNTVQPIVKKERVNRLIEMSRKNEDAYRHSLTGQIRPVLWENYSKKGNQYIWNGLTDNYLRVHTKNNGDLHNKILRALLVKDSHGNIYGELQPEI